MSTLRLVLADQLTHSLDIFMQAEKDQDWLLFCEVSQETSYVKHHKKKIVFLFAAMRHFAAECEAKGFKVRYVYYDDPSNSGSIEGEITRAMYELRPTHLAMTQAGEYRLLRMMEGLQAKLNLPVTIHNDNRFLCTINEFKLWAKGKKQLRMEYFYRDMRKKYGILLELDGSPIGGAWNFDKENRKSPLKNMVMSKRLTHIKSDILKTVINLVETQFSAHIGAISPFYFALRREQALLELDDFIENHLAQFGDYQDAMVLGEPYLFHSLLSTYINAGLLLPLEICRRAEEAFHANIAPLNAVEGFIRQILGWREYMRGIYWNFMPEYGKLNFFNAKAPLPALYWGAPTRMKCLSAAVEDTLLHAYSHHIQRLMVTGNFALIAGLDVGEVQEWYLAVYSDAYEWVEMPNTLGMSLFGDGGIVASKPYAASGKYINRMSNFCGSCAYDVDDLLGEKACPFNALYWDFTARNSQLLRKNNRMSYVYATWDKFQKEKQRAIYDKSQELKALLAANKL